MRGIPGAPVQWVTLHYIVDAGTAAQRWVQAAGSAQQRYVDGVQSTQKDPTQLAIQAQPKLIQNFNAAVNAGRYQRGLAAVGKAGWQSATVAKANNYSTGINASEQKFLAAIGPVLQYEAQLQAQIASMPNNTLQDSIARMSAWATGMYNFGLNR